MRIQDVCLQGFGQFNRGLQVSFSDDRINLVVGRNEAGKSTLLNSIFGILFGFRDLNLGRKYEPWDEHDTYAGHLTMELDDGRVIRISRDFSEDVATVEQIGEEGETEQLFQGRADPRGNTPDDHAYFRLIGELLGFQDEAVFRNTVFFGQQSLQTAVSDQIRRLISGSGNVDYKGALHELHSRYAELTNENPWKSRGKARKRLIEATRAKIESEEEELETGRRSLLRTVELEQDLQNRRQQLADAEEALRLTNERSAAREKLFELLGRRESAQRRYQEALGRRDQFQRYSERSRELQRRLENSFGQYRNVPGDFADKVRAFENDSGQLEREEQEYGQQKRRLDALKPAPNNGLGIALAVLMLAVGIFAGATTAFGMPAGVISGIVLGILGWTLGRQIGTGYRSERRALEDRVSRLRSSITARKRRCDEILATSGSAIVGRDAATVLGEFQAYQELREELKRVSAAMKALGGAEDIESTFGDASKEHGAVESSLEELRDRNPDLAETEERSAVATALDGLRAEHREIEARCERDRRAMEDARVELAGLTAKMDFDIAELEERLQDRRFRLDGYDLERDALKESIDCLDLCIKDFQESDLFRLSDEISGIFRRITDDKYTRVQLGASMEPIISRGDQIPISPSDLSQGARDQLYFAMRVAMARHLSQNVKLPLFLDDPFVNFDDDRLQITRGILDHLKDQHQVIMVTCDRSYAEWGGNNIDLDTVKAAA